MENFRHVQRVKDKGQVFLRQGFMTFSQTCPDCHGNGVKQATKCSVCKGLGYKEATTAKSASISQKGSILETRLRVSQELEISHK